MLSTLEKNKQYRFCTFRERTVPTVLYFTVLYLTVLYFTVLHFTVL